jgi:hypothetical protein
VQPVLASLMTRGVVATLAASFETDGGSA